MSILMVAILAWGKDLTFMPVESVQAVHDLKRRLDRKDTDYIIHDSVFLCPIKMDQATRELTESEQVEWLNTKVYPVLGEEGRMTRNKHGKYVRVKTKL